MLVNHHKKEAENEGQNHKQAGPTYTIRHIPLTIRDIPDNNYWIRQNYIMSTLC